MAPARVGMVSIWVVLGFVQTPTLCNCLKNSPPHMQDVRGQLPLGAGQQPHGSKKILGDIWQLRLESMDFSASIDRHICPRNSISNEGVLDAQEVTGRDPSLRHLVDQVLVHVDMRGLCSDRPIQATFSNPG